MHVIDLRPNKNGTPAAPEVVILGSSDNASLVSRLLADGASSAAVEGNRAARLLEALANALTEFPDDAPAVKLSNGTPSLTPREVEVLELIALGHTNPEIAGQLVISVRTVEAHRRNMAKKTGSGTRAELVSYGLGNGLIKR